ncbi:MAG: hypothetical protein CMJ78_03045 [Planctomycetaceae bacterium]|nr:hypothetical protein [Planctomycetaceae bacterium]
MRLTLRTLLAYLDDILDPSDAREIGQKATESSFASELISRIRDVMRQRRLTAPEVSGPGAGLDPNSVSEYLDNTLPPENVADIERVCLESDVHLAEVAACHQILTLVLGEPVEVLPEMRERIYSLGPKAKQAVEKEPRTNGRPAAKAPTKKPGSFDDQIPDYLKPKPVWKRVVVPVCVMLLFGIWVSTLFLEDSSGLPQMFRGRSDGSMGHVQTPIASNDEGEPTVPEGNSEPKIDNAVAETTTTDIADATNSTTPKIPGGLNATPPADLPEVPFETPPKEVESVTEETPPVETPTAPSLPIETPTVADNNATATPTANASETPAAPDTIESPTTVTPEPKDVANNSVKPALPTPIQEPALPVKFTSPDGVMLHYDVERSGWFVFPNRQAVPNNQWVATPEPYTNVLDVGDGMCRVKMQGNTAVRTLGATNAGLNGFEIVRGKISFEAGPAMSINPDEHPVLGVQINDEYWRLELLTPDARCGIQIDRRAATKLEQDLGRYSYDGALYVVSGSVRWISSSGEAETIEIRDWRPLTPELREAAKDPEQVQPKEPLLDVPEWLDDLKKSTRVTQQSAKLFEREFDDEQAIGLFMPAVIKAPRPRISELAVQCLALTNNHEALVQAIAQSEHEESRMAAIHGLRTWLPTAVENRKLLRDALSKYFQPNDIDTMYELLWGYEKKSGTNKYTSHNLVSWLQHDHIAIRELAIYHIQAITGKRNDFRANASEPRRQASVNRWLTLLKKEGTLIPE